MKPDLTPTIEEIIKMVDQLQEFEKIELVRRIQAGGSSVIQGRFNHFFIN